MVRIFEYTRHVFIMGITSEDRDLHDFKSIKMKGENHVQNDN